MKRILFFMMISVAMRAQIKPQVNLTYNVGFEIVGTDVLGLVNNYHDMIHPNREAPFLQRPSTAFFFGPQVEAGVHFDGRFSALLVFGQDRASYGDAVEIKMTGQHYSLTSLYTRHTAQMHFGGKFGYRFSEESLQPFYLNFGVLYIQRLDELYTEYLEVDDGRTDLRMLSAEVAQQAWGIPLEAGQDYALVQGLTAGWFFTYTFFRTRFDRSEIVELNMNGENVTQDLSERERIWRFDGRMDNPDQQENPRSLQKRSENLMRLSLGVRMSYRF